MTDIIIITALAVVLGVIIGYQIGKASVKQPDTTPGTPDITTALLDKWKNEIRITKTSTRYVRIEHNNLDYTNDRVEELEIKGYAVTDYDTENKLITMEKEVVLQPKTIESGTAVYIVTEGCDNGGSRNIACFGNKKEAEHYANECTVRHDRRYVYEEWKVGETMSHEP